MEVSTRCDMACDILRVTNDGEELDPKDLSLLEWAVNGHFTELGEERFCKLYDTVTKDKYVKPYWHGVKYITRDHEGISITRIDRLNISILTMLTVRDVFLI